MELPIGLPPKHFAELCERYERYFKGDGKVQELCFNDKVYHLCIQNVMAFPQGLCSHDDEDDGNP